MQEMRVQEMNHYILSYPQAFILYDSPEAAAESRTKNQKLFHMEIYEVKFHKLVLAEEDAA